MTEGTEERKETGVQSGRRENLVLVPVHGVEPAERRESLVRREQRVVQALATKERRESLDSLDPLVPPALQGLQLNMQSAVTAQWLPESPDPEDHQVPQAPRDHQEQTESLATPVRMENLVLMGLQASREPQGTLDLRERRETVEKVNLAPGDPLGLQDPQDLDSDLLLWTWRVQDSRIWIQFGDCLAHQVSQVLLVLPVPQQAQHQVLGHLDHQERTERPVNVACLVCRVLMASQEFLVPREKRVTQASWVFQEQSERRELKETLVYQDLQERPDWLVCPDPWDLLGHLDLPGLLDQVTALASMTWRPPAEVSPMGFLVPEARREYRVLPACLDFQANLGSLVYRVRRAAKVL